MNQDKAHSSKPIMGERHFQNVDNEEDYKSRWDQSGVHGPFSRAPSYECVNVLLLTWKECCDNSHTWEEVDKLEHVFKDSFYYDTQRVSLCRHESRNIQTQLNVIITGFAGVPKEQNTLFIVYFAGHAIPANYSHEMLMYTGMSSATKDQVRLASIEMLLEAAEKDLLFIFDWHVSLLWTTETTLTKAPSHHARHVVLPPVETPTETAEKTETMIRKSKRLGTYGSGEINASPGKHSFTPVLIRALVHLLGKTPEGRFTTSKLLSEIMDSEDFDTEKHPSLIDWITRSGMGRIVLHPLPKDQIASIPSQAAKLGIEFTFRNLPSIDDIGTLSKELNDQFSENELGTTGIDFVSLRAAAPDSPSTSQEVNDHASNESKANDVIEDDVPVDTKPSTLRFSNEQQ